MITLQNILIALARLGVDPVEIPVPRSIYAYILRQAQKIVRKESEEDQEADSADDFDTEEE